ncbi:MAG: methionine ABC transporter ATP-binding protein [Deltaproteobacteria bacterium]|nr:methionine ABC transporter ATP-binding protein [Deltaproteobacteria bacterium]
MIEVAVLELKDVKFRWSRSEKTTIDLPELRINQGERVFLQGPSASGKTTLLSLVGGILVPESGSLRVLGEELKSLSRARRDAFRVTHLGFIFQLFNLLPYLSLEENVLLPLRFSKERAQRAGGNEVSRIEEARRLLSALGLSEPLKEGRPVMELSVGQQQRVAAARALIGRPELVIADEPTSALDADLREVFLNLLFAECDKAGSALLFVSHDAGLGRFFDRSLSLPQINRVSDLEAK